MLRQPTLSKVLTQNQKDLIPKWHQIFFVLTFMEFQIDVSVLFLLFPNQIR